jgi:outer membrane protein TolC
LLQENRMRCFPKSFLFLLALANAAALAQPTPLTLAEAQAIAARQSRALAAQAASVRAAREMAVAAGQRPDPVLRLGIGNLPVQGPERFSLDRDFMTMRSIGVMQEITRADKLAARSRRYEQEALAAQAEQDAARRAVRREAALAWVELQYAQRAAAWLERQLAEARRQEVAALAALRGARGSQAEVVAARPAPAQLEDRAAATARDVATGRIALARWIGDDAARPLAATGEVVAPPEASQIEQRLAAHPRLRALAQLEAAAEAQAAAADAARRPDWTVELMYSQRGRAFSDMVSVNLSVPLQVDRAQRQDRELAARHAEVLRRQADREDALRASISDAQALLSAWHSTQERGALIDTELDRLRLAREAARLAVQLADLLGPEAGKETP